MAIDTSYDNRETCVNPVPTSCLPYTGYVSDSIKELLPCRPNANDVFKNLQILIDKINKGLGDNTKLDEKDFSFNPTTDSQQILNQELIDNVSELNANVQTLLEGQVDPDLIKLAVSLMCIEDSACDPKEQYSLTEILTKLINSHCELLNRVATIEATLNI
jgi:hypothetical protein